MEKILLKFENNFPPYNEKICISDEKPKGDFLAWFKPGKLSASEIISRIYATLYEESAMFYPKKQTEARAYFVSQLMNMEGEKLKGRFSFKKTSYKRTFSNNTPVFHLEVFIGTHEEVIAYDKKHFPFFRKGEGKKKAEKMDGHCYPCLKKKGRTNRHVVIKTTDERGIEKSPEQLASTIAHEFIHAVDRIGERHSDMDFHTRQVLLRHLLVEVFDELGVDWT